MNIFYDWMKIVWQTGQPIFPYFGIFLVALAVVLMVVLFFYLLYRFSVWLPPFFRFIWWRVTALVSAMMRFRVSKKAQVPRESLTARWNGDQAGVSLSDIFPKKSGLFGKSRRPQSPLIVVLGPSNSGKTSLLSQASGYLIDKNQVSGTVDSVWWYFGQRLVVEIPNSYCSGIETSHLDSLCEQLRAWSPEQPISAILVVLPITLFQIDDPTSQVVLNEVTRAITALSKAAQYTLPLHLSLTHADQLIGFEAFTRVASHLDKNRLIYRPSLEFRSSVEIESGMSNWINDIQNMTMRCVVEAKVKPLQANLHELLHFGPSLANLVPSLGAWINSVFSETSTSKNRCYLEIIIFSGQVPNVASDRSEIWNPLPDIITNLDFVTTPKGQISLGYIDDMRRVFIRSLVFLSLVFVALGFAVPATIQSMHDNSKVLLEVANDRDLGKSFVSANRGLVSYDPLQIERVFSYIYSLDNAQSWYFLIPSSWFNDFKSRLNSYLGKTVQLTLVRPAMSDLQRDYLEIPKVINQRKEDIVLKIEDSVPYRDLDSFLSRQEIRSSSLAAAEKVDAGISYRDLMVLVNDDPSRIPKPIWRWGSSLPRSVASELHFEPNIVSKNDEAGIKESINILSERILNDIIEGNPIARASTELMYMADRFRRSTELTYEEVVRMSELVRDIQVEIDRPLASVLVQKQSQSLRFVQPALSRLASSNVASLSQSSVFSVDFIKRREAARNRLLALEQGLFGHIFVLDADNDRLVLGPDFKRFSLSLSSLMALPFMQSPVLLNKDIDVMNTFSWQLPKLERVKTLTTSFNSFSTGDALLFDSSFRLQIIRMARLQARRTITAEFINSLLPIAQVADKPAAPEAVTLVRSQIENIASVLRIKKQSLIGDDLADQSILNEILQDQVNRVLLRMERVLQQEDPYQSLVADTLRWIDASQPSRSLATHVRSGIKDQLLSIRERVKGQYISPVSDLYASLDALPSVFTRQDIVQRWRRTLDSMEAYDKGDIGSSLFELEQYFLGVAKISGADECGQLLAERSATKLRDEYFSRRLSLLDDSLTDACDLRISESKRRLYVDFADWFNKNIAGHVPFSSGSRSLDPVSRRTFSLMSDSYLQMRKRTGDGAISSWPQAVRNFISQMDGLMLRSVNPTASKPDAGNAVKSSQLSVRAKIGFNSQPNQAVLSDQIISWTIQSGPRRYTLRSSKETFLWELGDPIEIQFRWAADSIFTPVSAGTDLGQYSVNDRTVSFRFNSDWALFDLLRQNSSGGDPYESILLKFDIDVLGAGRRQTAKAFITLQALEGFGPLELDLPSSAPPLLLKADRSTSPSTSLGVVK